MSFFVQADLEALLPPDWLVEGLDDDADGTQDAFSAVQAYAENEIHNALGARYALPLPSSTALDAKLKSIAVHIAVEAVYERRPSAKMPDSLARKVTRAWDSLKAMAEGTDPLTPGMEPVKSPAVIIGEDSRIHTGTTRGVSGPLSFALALFLGLAGLLQAAPTTHPHPAAAMDSATLLTSIEDFLEPLVAERKGKLSVAETEEDAIELLANAPSKWRVVLSMDGDRAADDGTNPGGLVTGSLIAWVQVPKGMESRPGKGIHRAGTAGSPSFLSQLNWTIKKLRGVTLSHNEVDCNGLIYKGWSWLKFDEVAAFRTARAEFEILFAHDDPATDPEGTSIVTLPAGFAIVSADDAFYTVYQAGLPDGRIARFAADPETPYVPTAPAGYAVTSADDDFYTISYNGTAHGRIARHITA